MSNREDMSREPISPNPFTTAVYEYYLERGKSVSDNMLNVLDKTPLELDKDEQDTLMKFILPAREGIKQALVDYLRQADNELLEGSLRQYGDTIIGSMAKEVLESMKQITEKDAQTETLQPTARDNSASAGQEQDRTEKKAPIKKKLFISGILIVFIVLVIALTISFTFFNSPPSFSSAGLTFDMPEGYEARVESAYYSSSTPSYKYPNDVSGVKKNYLTLINKNDAGSNIKVLYPSVDSIWINKDVSGLGSERFRDITINGRRVLVYKYGSGISMYLVDAQLSLESTNPDCEKIMLELIGSAECKYQVFNGVPKVLSGDFSAIEGTWKCDGYPEHLLRFAYSNEDGRMYGMVDGYPNVYFWAKPDGWLYASTEGRGGDRNGVPVVMFSVADDGSWAYATIHLPVNNTAISYNQYQGIYKIVSTDPKYGLASTPATTPSTGSGSSSDMPPFPKYKTAEEQGAGQQAGPAIGVMTSSSSISEGGAITLNSRWYRTSPNPGNEQWFLIEAPSGKRYGKLMEIAGGTLGNSTYAGEYTALFPTDFAGANSLEKGRYQVFFVNYSVEYTVVHDYACAEFYVK